MGNEGPAAALLPLDFLKQRFPFVMVDRVLSFEKGKDLRALKLLSVNEPYFKGHFPDYPVFPGVLTIECFAQTAAILIRMEDGEAPGVFDAIGSVMDFRFLRPLFPGERLEVRMTITKAAGTNRIIEGKGTVDGELVATGKFAFGKLKSS